MGDLSDKDRGTSIIIDGKFHPVDFKIDGVIRKSVAPDKPGTYLVQVQLNGRVFVPPTSQMLRRFQRYPTPVDDPSGTAWDHIEVMNTAQPDVWHASFDAKLTFSEDGTTSFGIDLRVRKGEGSLTLDDRVVKFTFIPRDVQFV